MRRIACAATALEVGPILPTHTFVVDEFKVCLVNQIRGLKRMVRGARGAYIGGPSGASRQRPEASTCPVQSRLHRATR